MRVFPSMGLIAWDQEKDKYNKEQLVSNWARINAHNHTPGKGEPIPSAGIEKEAITQEKLNSEVQIIPHFTEQKENFIAKVGEFAKVTASCEAKLPSPVGGGIVGIVSDIEITTTIKVTVGKIYGLLGGFVTSFILAPEQRVLFESDGSNWYIISGLGGLLPITRVTESVTAKNGQTIKLINSGTAATAPPLGVNAMFGVIAANGATHVEIKTSEGHFQGDYIPESATSVKLTENQHAIFQSDGFNWNLIAGEVVNENKYEQKSISIGTPYILSITRPVIATIQFSFQSISAAGELIVNGHRIGIITGSSTNISPTITLELSPNESIEGKATSGKLEEIIVTYRLL